MCRVQQRRAKLKNMQVYTFSIERLIRLALGCQLLTDYRMTPRVVSLYRRNKVVELDPEEARLYLSNLLCGYEGLLDLE